MREELYNVLMHPDMLMECDFCLDLFRLDASKLVGVLFVDELDGDDGLVDVFGAGFADEGVGAAAYGA